MLKEKKSARRKSRETAISDLFRDERWDERERYSGAAQKEGENKGERVARQQSGLTAQRFFTQEKAGARICTCARARGGVCVCVRTHAKEYVYGWDCFMRASDKIASVTDANTYANYEKQLLSHVWEDYWSMLIWLKLKCSCCQSSTHTRVRVHK